MANDKKDGKKEEKGVVGTTADVGKGAAKGTVAGVKSIGGAMGRGVKKIGGKD